MRHRRLLAATLTLIVLAGGAAPPASAQPALSPADLHLASVNAMVTDLKSGQPLYKKYAEVAVPIASVTKLMTAMVVLDSGEPLDEWLTIVGWNHKLEKNAYSRLRIGSQARRGDLVRIALMSSENLATHVLARHHPGGHEAFVAAMNAKAAALGMTDSRFVDPAGLSPSNVATAADLAQMVRSAWEYPRIREYSTGHQHTVTFRNPTYTLPYGNTNPLVASSRWQVNLTKTGYLNEAGRCLVMIAEVDERPVAMVLLNSFGSRSPIGDAGRIRRWLTTGQSGPVAGAAAQYEQERSRAYRQAAGGAD